MNNLFTHSLQRNRDLLLIRLRLRQILKMLGFDAMEQIKITCAAFEIACREMENKDEAAITIALDGEFVNVFFHTPGSEMTQKFTPKNDASMSVRLPEVSCSLAEEDLQWALKEILLLDRPDYFQELRRHNQDLLCAMTLLQQSESADLLETLPLRSSRAA